MIWALQKSTGTPLRNVNDVKPRMSTVCTGSLHPTELEFPAVSCISGDLQNACSRLKWHTAFGGIKIDHFLPVTSIKPSFTKAQLLHWDTRLVRTSIPEHSSTSASAVDMMFLEHNFKKSITWRKQWISGWAFMFILSRNVYVMFNQFWHFYT